MSELQNPNNQPGGIDKRVIIVFGAAMLLLVAAQQFLIKPQPPASQPAAQQQAAKPQQAPLNQPATAVQPGQSKLSRNRAASTGKPMLAVQAASESTTVVDTDLYRVTFSNRGGLVKSWILKKYQDEQGHELELVNQEAAAKYGLPLELWTPDSAMRETLNSALYVANETGNVGPAKDLSFEYADGNLMVKKEFHFDNTYVVGVKTSVQMGRANVTALPAWPSGFGDATGLPSYAAQQIAYVPTDGDVKRLKLDKKGADISGGRVVTGNFQWVGVSDDYFGAIFLPEQPQDTSYGELRNAIEIPKDPAAPQGEKVRAEVLGVAVGALNAPSSVRLFVGPKAVGVLQTVQSANSVDLRSIVDFGFFGVIGRPIFAWVRWTQQHWTSNWGWTIILVTVLINIALLPLRISQIKSSMKMQKVSPQMQAIQAKYKKYKMDDPRRKDMQAEMAALYKEHDVNPVGGCLPLVVQMPFLFAFYSMLRVATELRHAHWLYLTDLSAPDHMHIIPIATIVLMVGLQRMMPATGMSKEQQKMMNLMTPIMFAMFTWSMPSGLGLYIITGSAVQIVQQWIMNRTSMGREMRSLAERRALKAAEKKR